MLDLPAHVSRSPGYAPDFVFAAPHDPTGPELDDELARVRATPHEHPARRLGWRFEGTTVPGACGRCSAPSERGLAELTATTAEYFERAIAPRRPDSRAALEDDILHRARLSPPLAQSRSSRTSITRFTGTTAP